MMMLTITSSQAALFVALVLFHFIGDWLLQPDRMAKTKTTNWKVRTLHVAIYTAVMAIVVRDPLWLAWIYVTHWLIDTYYPLYWFVKLRGDAWGKSLADFKQAFTTTSGFVVLVAFDQIFHFLTLAVVAYCL